MAEAASRVYWRVAHGVSMRDPGMILYAFYPEMWSVWGGRPSHDDGYYDVLLLGGSVLHPDWGSIQQQLEEKLMRSGHRNVRIFNLAIPAHTSRDSWLKYAALSEFRFERVVFYHGVNEARTNNAPPELFQQDYSHYWWYETLNTLAPYHGTARFALPYTIRFLGVRIKQSLFPERYILDANIPREDWVEFGRPPRSAGAFERNLRSIVEAAKVRGDGMVFMTYAMHVPADYSLEKFEAKQLDYVLHLTPLEVLGRPEYVVEAVDAHNEVVRRLAAEEPGALFVDQSRLMRDTPFGFNDAFHLTTEGCTRFVDNLIAVLAPALPRSGGGR